MVKLVMRVARVAPKRARCFNSKRTSFHVALELEHVESVDLRSAIRKADAVLPVFARAGQRSDTLKRVARPGRCRLLFRVGVQHIVDLSDYARADLPSSAEEKEHVRALCTRKLDRSRSLRPEIRLSTRIPNLVSTPKTRMRSNYNNYICVVHIFLANLSLMVRFTRFIMIDSCAPHHGPAPIKPSKLRDAIRPAAVAHPASRQVARRAASAGPPRAGPGASACYCAP